MLSVFHLYLRNVISCEVQDHPYGRELGWLYLADGIYMSNTLLPFGLALPLPFHKGDYGVCHVKLPFHKLTSGHTPSEMWVPVILCFRINSLRQPQTSALKNHRTLEWIMSSCY